MLARFWRRQEALMILAARELSRRQRVVHGWRFEFTTPEERQQIKLYLEGKSDKPPKRWEQIDKAMS